MKKWIAFLLCLSLVLPVFSGCEQDNRITINVYNWGQYISDGSDECIDMIAEFERLNPDIKVNYVTFDSNETMYTKMSNGGITVDVIIPSDYMVDRLRQEGMLQPLNYDNIPNAAKIDSRFRNQEYDPENKYSVPYAWGAVGIIYNDKYVDEADVTGWELLWNPKYADKILMFDNSRDAFCITQCLLGYDINTPEPQELLACAKKLAEQRPVVQQYIMDQVFDLMENEEAWIAPYYAGDYLTMADENEHLQFYLPEHQGFNCFIDAMCIPTCCENQEAAERFINFMCDPYYAISNMEWIGYGTPIAEDTVDPEQIEYPEAFPAIEVWNAGKEKGNMYRALDRKTTRLMESLFMQVRNGLDVRLD